MALYCLIQFACDNKKEGGSTAVRAETRHTDGGSAELVVDGKALPLPLDMPDGTAVITDQDGRRFSIPTANGTRYAYAYANSLWLGPLVKFEKAPDADHALGAMFASAGARRAELVAAVRKKDGEAGLVTLLADSAGTDAKEWNDAYAQLSDARAADVKKRLATLFETGKPTEALWRAVAMVPMKDPGQLDARIREVGPKEPRAVALMLRALTDLDLDRAAAAACVVLDPRASIDSPHAALDESALFSLASAARRGKKLTCSEKIAGALAETACASGMRCANGKPVSAFDPTKQDEPLCARAELEPMMDKEAARPAAEVGTSLRPSVFAYTAMVFANSVPPLFVESHLRRRYALKQPATPPCEESKPGTACHCEEAVLRDQTCRHPASAEVSVGLCKFAIDDKTKTIGSVVATLAP